jgi:hypothetical protein
MVICSLFLSYICSGLAFYLKIKVKLTELTNAGTLVMNDHYRYQINIY